MMILLDIDIPKLNKEGIQMKDSFRWEYDAFSEVKELNSSSMIE